MELNNDWNF